MNTASLVVYAVGAEIALSTIELIDPMALLTLPDGVGLSMLAARASGSG